MCAGTVSAWRLFNLPIPCSMELRTYTRLWSVEKRLYKLYDVSLPFPISVKQVVIFFGFGVPWFFLCQVLGIPFSPPFGFLIYLAPPPLLAYWGNKPVAEGKTLVDFVVSQVTYFFSARVYADMFVAGKEETFPVDGTVWSRTKWKKLEKETPTEKKPKRKAQKSEKPKREQEVSASVEQATPSPGKKTLRLRKKVPS